MSLEESTRPSVILVEKLRFFLLKGMQRRSRRTVSRTGTMDAKLHCSSRQELKVTVEYSGRSAEEGAMWPGGRGGAIKPHKEKQVPGSESPAGPNLPCLLEGGGGLPSLQGSLLPAVSCLHQHSKL